VIKIFLKKIRLKGFKSFAKKTDVEINTNITAIVGPNGSGKSNIVDAVRWVLGEQSARTLRGSRMADVIFAGSSERKQLHEASVTLFFDNTENKLALDGDEVTITRKVDEDGRGDYLINGASCRLKDIEMLLMDTGLGSDGYAIVGQGKIDSIIHSKPDKLRELFEEAAGITSHKSRKDEARNRLEKTDHDLDRVQDLISELERQYKPLEKAAEKAKKYKRISSELKELEVSLLNKQWLTLIDDFRYTETKRSRLENDLEQIQAKFTYLSDSLEQDKSKLRDLEIKKNDADEDFFQTGNKLNEIANSLNVLQERKKGVQKNKDKLKYDYKTGQESLKKSRDKLEIFTEKFQNKLKQENSIKTVITELKNSLVDLENSHQQTKDKISNLSGGIKTNDQNLREIEREKEKISERIIFNEKQIEETREKRSNFLTEKERLKVKKENKSVQINDIKTTIETKQNLLEDLFNQYNESTANIENKRADFDNLKETAQGKRSNLKLLKNMEEDHRGYYNGVRNLLNNIDQFNGIIGVIAELMEVKKTHETAIETALGAKMQNIVVETDQTARKAVNYLKTTGKGRATFLPLNMVSGSRLTDHQLDKIVKMPGYLGLAVDLVDFPDKLLSVFNNLMGRIVVAKNIDAAVEISKSAANNIQIVTLDGDVVYPGGAISGGSKKKNNGPNLLGRSRQIDDLENELEVLHNKTTLKQEELRHEEEKRENLQKEINNCKEEINQLRFELNDYQNDYNNIIDRLEQLQSELASLEKRYNDLHSKLGEFDRKEAEIKEDIAAINNGFVQDQEEVDLLEANLNKIKDNMEKLRSCMTEKKIELARVNQQKESLEEDRTNLKEEINDLEIQLEELNNSLAEADANIDSIDNRTINLDKKRNELNKQKEELVNLRDNLTEEIKKVQLKVDQGDNQLIKLQKELNKRKDEFHAIDLKYDRQYSKIERIKNTLEKDYGFIPGEIPKEELIKISDEDEKVVKNKIDEFKKACNKLHPVNEAAIDEFIELKDRLDFLKEQQHDLLKAKETIISVITDIETTMADLFANTFIKVKKEFSQIFRELFSGGRAELILSEPDDLLKTGVNINAQPPGKNLKSLSLLSGGERALTAIALVFAFLKVKPSPFYVLDEIDAPLDDVNVTRFAKFIRRYGEIAQFIIITHRRYMMTEVDTLYGVTMSESGVSRLLSLELNEKQIEEHITARKETG